MQFGRQGGVTHQLGGEPKMRFVSTALVMTAMALMLLALTLLTTKFRTLMLVGPVVCLWLGKSCSSATLRR